MKRHLILAALIATGAAMYLPLPAMAQQVGVNIVIGNPPPPPRYEMVPAPRRGYVWAPGYWNWNGRRHVWVQGHWEHSRRGQVYMQPEWRHDREGWRLNRGGWRNERHHGHDHGRHHGPRG